MQTKKPSFEFRRVEVSVLGAMQLERVGVREIKPIKQISLRQAQSIQTKCLKASKIARMIFFENWFDFFEL
ncbi:MAG: hypothetical protein C4K58_00410 [Flavobacteriaceae bacterium]|nr:MAG: hypothetical protein C4K58_00410 [Flavobacteriaceae bacterium]